MPTNEDFSVFGEDSFQTNVLHALIIDVAYSEQILDILDVEFFASEGHASIFEFLKENVEGKARFPSMEVLKYWVNEDLAKGPLRDQVVEILTAIQKSDGTEIEYVKEKSIEFCKNQAMKNALIDSVDLLGRGKYDEIFSLMQDALLAGQERDLGHVYFEDLENRNQKIMRNPIATGMGAPLDDILGGGLSSGELGCVLAPTGIGKSMALLNIAYGAMMRGLNVVYYTLELSETQVGVRMDARVCNMPIDQVYKSPLVVGKQLEKIKDTVGRLVIKQFPTKGASVTSIKGHIAKLKTTKFIPDLIIIDYADLMKPLSRFKEKRHELESIYESLRGMAVELGVPIWTASQSNRSSMDKAYVTLSDISESYAKAQVADVIISIQRSIDEKRNNKASFFVAKNRAGRDGIVMEALMDTATAYIEVLNEIDYMQDDERVVLEDPSNSPQGKDKLRAFLKGRENGR
jgi:replicative DNA helicase